MLPTTKKTTARVILTFRCNRACPGCCNGQLPEHRNIYKSDELMNYEELVLTGGEPMLFQEEVISLIDSLRQRGYTGKVYMYTSFWDDTLRSKVLLSKLDGFTFTLHAECTDKDIMALKALSACGVLKSHDTFHSRLIIDKRVYDRYDLSNIDLREWDVIRKLEWKESCDPAPNEDLLVYEGFWMGL